MRWNTLKELFILVGIFGFLWIAFSVYKYDVKKNPLELSIERESELSEFMSEYLMADFDLIQNQALDSSLNIILKRLISAMDTSSYQIKLHVIEGSQLNAFTSLNGNIYVFTGLIQKLESPEELAVILAHEIGHAEKKHVINKLIKTLGLEALFSIVGGADPVLISEIAKLALYTSFDREKEEEADDFALNLAYKSNINPRRLAQFFLKLKSEKKVSLPDELEFIQTHPMDNSRIKKSSDYQLPEGFKEIPFDLEWSKVQQMLN